MKFNILYGKHENLAQAPLQEGNLYVTDKGYIYLDVIKNNILTRSEVVGKKDWDAQEDENGYIKNRTHWRERDKQPVFPIEIKTSYITEIYEQQFGEMPQFVKTIVRSGGEDIVYSNWSDGVYLFENQIYIITDNTNNIQYTCTCWTYTTDLGEVYYCLGNSHLTDPTYPEYDYHPEEVPFLIMQNEHIAHQDLDSTIHNTIDITLEEGLSTITVEKLLDTYTYYPLDDNYIPTTIARIDQIPQGDWLENDVDSAGYISNRTHYIGEETYDLAILKNINSQLDYVVDEGSYPNFDYTTPLPKIPDRFFIETPYVVELDGVEYKTSSFWSNWDGGALSFALGDSRLMQWYDSEANEFKPLMTRPEDVPFYLEWKCQDTGSGSMWQSTWTFKTIDENPHDIIIRAYSGEQGFKKLDYRYIPSVSWSTPNGKSGSVLNRTHYTDRGGKVLFNKKKIPENDIIYVYGNSTTDNGFIPYQNYVVIFDDIYYDNLYARPLYENDQRIGYYIGDGSVFSDEYGANTVPFAIKCIEDFSNANKPCWKYYVYTDKHYVHTISISEKSSNTVYHKLDKQYLPEGIAFQEDLDIITQAMSADY